MSDAFEDGFQYQILEREAEKRRQREQLELMMAEFLSAGGRIRRVDAAGSPKPVMKYHNRKQRKAARDGER